MRRFIVEGGMPIAEQPLDTNEVGQEIIARRTFLMETIIGTRVIALARPEPEYNMPRILSSEFYGEGE